MLVAKARWRSRLPALLSFYNAGLQPGDRRYHWVEQHDDDPAGEKFWVVNGIPWPPRTRVDAVAQPASGGTGGTSDGGMGGVGGTGAS